MPALLSPEQLEGRAGLREMFFQPAEEVVVEGGLQIGLCVFWACVGPSLLVALCQFFILSKEASRAKT